MSFKRWPVTQHGSRTRVYQLEWFSTVDVMKKEDCLMLDGFCWCKKPEDCKYFEKLIGEESKK